MEGVHSAGVQVHHHGADLEGGIAVVTIFTSGALQAFPIVMLDHAIRLLQKSSAVA